VLDFHHIKDKREGIATLSRKGSLRLLKEELKKCIPVCSNCHREIHYKEGNWNE
jgi:predicted HNH restriction endonuclease